MDPIPDMWRTELWHPLVVHFPIALLLFGTPTWLIGAFVDPDGRWGFLQPAGRLALTVGTLAAWIAVYTGGLADAEVVRTLCDPTVVELHEELAWATAATFSVAVIVDLASLYLERRKRAKIALRWLTAAGLLVACGLLGYVGHLGSSLVYQQGAAVYHPSATCEEFE